jgi:hypothetical protein
MPRRLLAADVSERALGLTLYCGAGAATLCVSSARTAASTVG